MIICLFGINYHPDYDATKEIAIDTTLIAELKSIDGFISLHSYYSEDKGETIGVIRFKTRDALEAWRNHPTHRKFWSHAPEFYSYFWVQSCETYREYGWTAEIGKTAESMSVKFSNDERNRANECT